MEIALHELSCPCSGTPCLSSLDTHADQDVLQKLQSHEGKPKVIG